MLIPKPAQSSLPLRSFAVFKPGLFEFDSLINRAMGKENPTKDPFGEISIIRDILVGPQLAELRQGIEALQAEQAEQKKDLAQRLKKLEDQLNKRLEALEEQTRQRFEALEKHLEAKFQELESKLNEKSESDKKTVGQIMEEMAKRLINQ
ncbi:MAG: hypothetical protein D6765_17530 [Bacteroidetes bacterium]|nr:MAG: hypothetical protein D6765_17530 [Bacteroidota bacterium]